MLSIRNALAVGLVGLLGVSTLAEDSAPRPKKAVRPHFQAHAHNDYYHARPLLDALDRGFASVEADIFLVDGKLLVGHSRRELKADRTLSALYLEPLRQRVQANAGRVFGKLPSLTLLIDLKSDGLKTYDALHDVLTEYKDILSSVEDGKFRRGAVSVVISGNRPKGRIAEAAVRYAGIDGRLSDLDSDMPRHLLPLISDNWRNHFRWRGEGPISQAERKKLHDIVHRAHKKGRRIRFWATPDNAAVWQELYDAGVDHINTDDLAGLSTFLEEQAKSRVQRYRDAAARQ